MTTLAFPAHFVPASAPTMKATVSIPHMIWRDGRPRFVPGPALRKLGFEGRDLKHPDGRWFSLRETEAEAERIVADVTTRRQAKAEGKRLTVRPASSPRYITVADLAKEYFALPSLNGIEIVEGKKKRKPLKASTVRWYKKLARAIEDDEPDFWFASAAAVTTIALDGVIAAIETKRGLATARGCRALLSAMWGRIGKKHRLTQAIFADMDQLPVLDARLRSATPAQMSALIKAADAIGLPEIGDSVMIGLASSQRQNDRLALTSLGIVDGRLKLQQSKRGAIIDLPLWPALQARLAASARRRAANNVKWTHVIIDEEKWRPFSEEGTDYRHKFARARDAAIWGIADVEASIAADRLIWIVEPCPELAGFHDQDLRDTAATWAYEAMKGAYGPDLAKSKLKALTGHKGGDNNAVLNRHYLDVQAVHADETVSAVRSWLDGQGVKL
jgi:hypothetical protein